MKMTMTLCVVFLERRYSGFTTLRYIFINLFPCYILACIWRCVVEHFDVHVDAQFEARYPGFGDSVAKTVT